ncbi:MAG: DivIVA domain-containing protein [Oscillospiraceae bacterium]
MNTKDIGSKKFEKATLGGYKAEEVDEFLRDLSIEFAQLQKDKETCEKKIEVLADKVREYIKDEDALKDALLGAQRQGHLVIEQSQIEANKIISEANDQANKIVGQTKTQLEKEKNNLANMQKEVSDFKANLLTLYKSHLDLITAMPEVEETEIISQVQDAISETDDEDEQVQQPAQEKTSNYPFSNPTSKINESRYGDLKFGHNSK